MANIYTVNQITTPQIVQATGLLNLPNSFPPDSNLYLTIDPLPGEDISAAHFNVSEVLSSGATIPMLLSEQGDPNSQTQWPSRFEWTMSTLGQPAAGTQSGLIEFPAFYKVVLTDSENPTNASNFTGGGSNKVYVWIYFGRNETTPVQSAVDITVDIDIDYTADALTLSDVTASSVPGSNLNNFNI
jgi:hypothetical protein